MQTADIFSLSIRNIRSNKLRSGITIAIIALGIMALIGIITAIQAMNQKLTESFSTIGANGFSIRLKERSFRVGSRRELQVSRKGEKQAKESNLDQPITVQQAEAFRELYSYPSTVGISCTAGGAHRISFAAKQTNPTVSLFGADEANLELNGTQIEAGRNFIAQEITSGAGVCILGYDVVTRLFGDNPEVAVGKTVRIDNGSYRVVGTLKSRGSVFGFSRDNIALVVYKNAVRNFPYRSFNIGVKAPQVTRVDEAIGEAEGLFRNIRKLAVTEESNFVVERSNSLAEKAINSLRYITIAVTIIGLITLTGAAIGLMNIMLVAVAERTKEIGLLKSIGAKKKAIRLQFLSEAVLLCLAGAFIGIAAGIAFGNLFGVLLRTNFVVPWNWIAYGIGICTIVGLAAGVYPALKAASLNPIEALRYE